MARKRTTPNELLNRVQPEPAKEEPKEEVKEDLKEEPKEEPREIDLQAAIIETVLEKLQTSSLPAKQEPVRERGSKQGLQPGWERFTITARSENVNKLKDYAYTERLKMKDLMDDLISDFLKRKEDEGVELLQRPEMRK